jgi:hypothetical protein
MRTFLFLIAVLCSLLTGVDAVAAPLSAPQALHVLNRMAYGPRPGDIERVRAQGLEAYVDEQLGGTRVALTSEAERRVHELGSARVEASGVQAERLARQETLLRAIGSARQLEEVLVRFWMDRAAGGLPDWAARARFADAIRPHVFGAASQLAAADPALKRAIDKAGPRKLSRALAIHFVGDAPPSALVARVERVWRQSSGDQKQVLRALLLSPEFLSPAAQGGKRKDAFRLVVSAVRAGGVDVADAGPLEQALVPLEARRSAAAPGSAEWKSFAEALASGRLALMAEPPRPHRQASSAPPLRATPGREVVPGAVAPAVAPPAQAPTPAAAAMAAATRTPPLAPDALRAALGPGFLPATLAGVAGRPPERASAELLGSAEFFRY